MNSLLHKSEVCNRLSPYFFLLKIVIIILNMNTINVLCSDFVAIVARCGK